MSQLTGIRVLSYWNGPMLGFRKPKCYKRGWKGICKLAVRAMVSYDETVYNEELMKKYYEVAPVGTSMKTIMHYMKLAESEEFKPYSYNADKNKKEYDMYHVKPYPLENVNVPTLLLMGPNDHFTQRHMIDKLKKRLKKLEKRLVEKWVDNTHFKHIDFVVGKNLKRLVFEPILEFLNNEEIIIE